MILKHASVPCMELVRGAWRSDIQRWCNEKLVGSDARKTQVQILTLPPSPDVNLAQLVRKDHFICAVFPPLLSM